MDLLSADNLIFVLPLAAAILLVLLMALGTMGADHDLHFHADAAHGHDFHAEHAPGYFHAVAEFFGIGRVPFAIVLVSAFMLWGISGLATGLLATKWTIVSRLALAAAASLFGTRFTASTIGRLMPSVETYSTAAEDLVGRSATVLHEIGPDGGFVRLVDEHASLRDLPCRAPTPETPIPHGESVILTEYDARSGTFTVSARAATNKPRHA